jgi:hypothetical protein
VHAYLNSEYNKSCRDGNDLTTAAISITPTLPTSSTPSNSWSEEPVTVTEDPNMEMEHEDLAPILWMERFHLFACGFCTLFAIIFFVGFIVKDNLGDLKLVRGIVS